MSGINVIYHIVATTKTSYPRSMFNVRYSTTLPALRFGIIALVIDIVGASKDTDLLKELASVSHSFF